MKTNKNWYKSKTVQSAIFTAFVTIASAIVGETNTYVALAISIGSVLGIYGRVTATEKTI